MSIIHEQNDKLTVEAHGMKVLLRVTYPHGLEQAGKVVLRAAKQFLQTIIDNPNQFKLKLTDDEPHSPGRSKAPTQPGEKKKGPKAKKK